jgi:hypothetical protein
LQITLRECPSGALIWEIKSSDVTLILDEQGGGLTQLFAVALLAQLVSVDIRPPASSGGTAAIMRSRMSPALFPPTPA